MATTPQEPLQDRLKEQVAVSVKDALERTTTILSNLHRVQSYLDILQTMSSPSGGPQGGLKSAMLQVNSGGSRGLKNTMLQVNSGGQKCHVKCCR